MRGSTLNVKLNPCVGSEAGEKIFQQMPGLRSVTRTFPGESDPELAGMYVLEVEPSSVPEALRKLRKSGLIDYAEETAPRKLLRKQGVGIE
ncbi:MAG TPA: hypothetical protein VLZ81_10735 [Blastocatellia bacterium]|nr:hypothetical protein [Blastocatellia bacterium]